MEIVMAWMNAIPKVWLALTDATNARWLPVEHAWRAARAASGWKGGCIRAHAAHEPNQCLKILFNDFDTGWKLYLFILTRREFTPAAKAVAFRRGHRRRLAHPSQSYCCGLNDTVSSSVVLRGFCFCGYLMWEWIGRKAFTDCTAVFVRVNVRLCEQTDSSVCAPKLNL